MNNTKCLYCGRTVKASQAHDHTPGYRWYHVDCKKAWR